MSSIEIPTPKHVTVVASELRKMFPALGKTQLARVGTETDWDTFTVKNELKSRGWIETEGPMPSYEEGAESVIDGNRRLTALAELAEELPQLFGKVKVKIAVYPTLTDEQRNELINRAARSTQAFTIWDYYRQSMNLAYSNPGLSQLDHAKRMGVARIRTFFPLAINDEALVKTPQGIQIRDDVDTAKVFRNKQGPVQVGIALSKAHPEVVAAFFAARTDPEHSISYREVISMNGDWDDDKKTFPDLASPPASLSDIAEKTTDKETGECSSKLVSSLGARLANGKGRQAGREAGKGSMSKKEINELMNSLNACSPFVDILHFVVRDPGTTEATLVDLQALGVEIQASLSPEAKKLLTRIHNRAAAANKAIAASLKK